MLLQVFFYLLGLLFVFLAEKYDSWYQLQDKAKDIQLKINVEFNALRSDIGLSHNFINDLKLTHPRLPSMNIGLAVGTVSKTTDKAIELVERHMPGTQLLFKQAGIFSNASMESERARFERDFLPHYNYLLTEVRNHRAELAESMALFRNAMGEPFYNGTMERVRSGHQNDSLSKELPVEKAHGYEIVRTILNLGWMICGAAVVWLIMNMPSPIARGVRNRPLPA